MAHSRSHSQPVQYRYRPNAPARSSIHTTQAPVPIPNACQSRGMLVDSQSCYMIGDDQLMPQYVHPTFENDVKYNMVFNTPFTTGVDQPTVDFQSGLQQMGYLAQLSPSTAPWESDHSSISGDACSAAWSSSGSSTGFSPEPTYQVPFTDAGSWSMQSFNSYIGTNCVSMHEVFPTTGMDLVYVEAPLLQPEMPQRWQFQTADDLNVAKYESPEYCSPHSSPESVTDSAFTSSETVTMSRPRTESTTTCSMSPQPHVKESGSSSTSPQTRASPPQPLEQLLEFTSPVAQTKTKGPKFAALPCPIAAYGCSSSFISKNEWKRHINTQHLRLEAWLCDQCPKRDNKREFNRKDLFIQHLKRMHPPQSPPQSSSHGSKPQPAEPKATKSGSRGEKLGKGSKGDDLDPALLKAEQRCHVLLRQPPNASACLFCSTNFSGRGSWEARIEHVAKHMEQYKKEGNEVPEPKSWRADRSLEQWLVTEGVITKVRQKWSVV
ncbi:hypothetical protein AAFC00_006218 [Neodothiora populina]